MVVWLSFLLLVIACLFLLKRTNRNNYIYYILCFLFIYFSAFRDGLGNDYENYLNLSQDELSITWFEPVYSILSNISFYTNLSEVFIFLFFSIITHFFLFKTFKRYDNTCFIILLYLLIPGLFFNSFNLVRQFAAMSIFLYSWKYLEARNTKKLFIFLFFASLIHLSTILCVFSLFFLKRKYPIPLLLVLYFMSFAFLFNTSLPNLIIKLIPYYSQYYGYVSGNKLGFSLFFFNILFLFSLFYRNKFYQDVRYIIVFNAFFAFIVLYNLSLNISILFRLSVFFMPSVVLLLPKMYSFVHNFSKPAYKIIILSVFMALFINGIVLSSNEYIKPRKILSPLCLFDKYYYPEKIYYINTNRRR